MSIRPRIRDDFPHPIALPYSLIFDAFVAMRNATAHDGWPDNRNSAGPEWIKKPLQVVTRSS